jgi:hypothetical protein
MAKELSAGVITKPCSAVGTKVFPFFPDFQEHLTLPACFPDFLNGFLFRPSRPCLVADVAQLILLVCQQYFPAFVSAGRG